ncbi:MAG: hypothetical protein SFU56_17375 [Capsulimonadales bacterium]|nr:hypothetical protein [Capsulimonadales bacterium]
MVKMNSQTKIIVFTAVALTAIDLSVRFLMIYGHRCPSGSDGVLTAREIRLVDDQGNLRAHLRTDENREPGLVLYDRNNVNRLQLDTWQNVPSLILHRPDGQRSTYYGMDTEGMAIFDMYGGLQETLFSVNAANGLRTRTSFSSDGTIRVHGRQGGTTFYFANP